MNIIPVVLSGGSGSRLWPVSRASYPKQLLALCGAETLLQQTIRRAMGMAATKHMVVVCGQEHRFQVADQVHAVGITAPAILLEPMGRNTAPAIALAAYEAMALEKNPVLLVLPSDHTVKQPQVLAQAVQAAMPHVEDGVLMAFGVKPGHPATGYGYIKAKQAGLSAIESFVEKPDAATAQKYLDSGKYYWNSGMFLFRADVYLNELKRFEPEMAQVCLQAYQGMQRDLDFKRIPAEIFAGCPANSIDYAVMEKTDKAMVAPIDAGWSDLGSWESLWDISEKDAQNNAIVGDVVLHDVRNSYVRAESRLVSAVGIEDCIIVETTDAVLVAAKGRVEEVKAIVHALNKQGRGETNLHRRVYRPWGSYESVDESDRFKVKRITVKPRASLSLQMHHHRAEHWVVVKGTAKVTCDDKQYILSENESTYIPLGSRHRLENPGNIELELIEVQSGSYLEEDDIVRLEDKYGR